jgi:formate/nitrite transporter FocA (FNT family)
LNDSTEAEQRSNPSAIVVHEAIRKEGEEELGRPPSSLLWSGFAAGLSIGLSLMAEGLLRAGLPDVPWRGLVTSIGYTAGFLVVVLGRQQLYTENTLTGVVPVLHNLKWTSALALGRLWCIVFLANIAGTVLFAWAAADTQIFSAEARAAFSQIGEHAARAGFWLTFLRAIVAGWMIALMVWLLPAAGSARFLVIVAITYLIGLADLAHVIAGSAEVAYAAIEGAVGWDQYATGFVLPAFLGNTVGGVLLVAVLNHAQVRNET